MKGVWLLYQKIIQLFENLETFLKTELMEIIYGKKVNF